MTGRKRVLLIAASILAARRLVNWDGRPSPAFESAIADAITLAERILAGGRREARDRIDGIVSLTIEHLTKGIRYWRTTDWPQDFHNSYYERVLAGVRITNGTFDLQWWNRFYPILHDWRATRPASRLFLTSQAERRFGQLEKTWLAVIAPNLREDIETLEWSQVAAFPLVVTEVKPLKHPSPVFTSKFCHFLAPRIFPIVDNAAMGNTFATYEAYFTRARGEWLGTDGATQAELVRVLTQAIGAPTFGDFPMKCKLIELCLIGRYAERS